VFPGLAPTVRLIRPKQWTKNAFVFAPLIFARELFESSQELLALRAFAAFCAMASAVYVMNDLSDVAADRAHPVKKSRPIAAGIVSVPQALLIIAGLLVLSAVAAWGMDPRFITVLTAYAVINIAYSIRLKEVLLLDVFIVAAGFMLRVLGGAYAIGVSVSSWIVLCSLFISLFLGFAKRRGEMVLFQASSAPPERKVLRLYTIEYIDQILTIAAAGAVISYAMYTVAPRTMEVFHTDKLIYTTVFVVFGIFRYLYLIHTTSTTENPTAVVTSDLPVIFTILFWVASCVALIYFGPSLSFFSR
jgi:4-hydroxybenzoate polyprenyltransferase